MNHSSEMRFAVAALFVVTLMAIPGFAQSTAQISGSVRDQTGAVLPGVEVTATQTATGVARAVVTDETGLFALPSLQIGPYMLEATLPGFRSYVQTGIVLQVNSSPVIPIVLEVGQVSEQIEVSADAALVETQSSSIGTVVDNQRILEMPLNGRNVTELIFLAGMATPAGALNSVRNYPTISISVAGGTGLGVTYNLDGTNHNDAYNNLNLPMPFPDALQEFKVETSALPAQYGFHSSAAVNAVTKSGTNDFHGNLFEFLRNGNLNARNFFCCVARHAEAESIRRNARRADYPKQAVLLRRLPGHDTAIRTDRGDRIRPNTGYARRRLSDHRFPRLRWTADHAVCGSGFCRQPDFSRQI